ncbi:MAG: glycogen synthase GlgA [Planctomycetes bacterium]|nr:glycogen synthase GlgA [Planctomycetota bacterium]
MRVLYVASEVAGFAKTGGLADVAAALPRALAERGLDIAVALPLYRCIRNGAEPLEATGLSYRVHIGNREVTGGIVRSQLPGTKIPVFLIEQPDYFERDDPIQGAGLYHFTRPDGVTTDYTDNALRFGFFCRAVLEALPLLDFWPEVIHLNDWQTGLIPVYMREIYTRHPLGEFKTEYSRIRTLCTVHNLAYQGAFPADNVPLLGLPWKLFNFEELEFYGHVNFLKAGLVFSDLLTTVSPTYAREIQTPYFGCGLHGVLLHRSAQLTGIVNGADYRIWCPANDPFLKMRYDESNVAEGKATAKADLQKSLELDVEPQVPLLGMVSRLADQKGLDLVNRAAAWLLQGGLQFAVLGQGDLRYHRMLTELRRGHPRQVGIHLMQDERLAHLIEAGADMFLMPSLYEPCGLSQLYSLKYGTVPVVRATGGLVDTVVDATEVHLAAGTATGFAFVPYTAEAFLGAIKRAVTMFRDRPEQWRSLQRTGMQQDWSWNRSAAAYERLYRAMVGAI